MKLHKLWTLFREMMFLSAFVIGGGYVILSVADERFSKKRQWIHPGELFEMLPLFQMIPGVIGGHVAVYLGDRVSGALGSAVAVMGLSLPSICIFLGVSVLYHSIPVESPLMAHLFLGLRAALTGIMFDMVIRTWRKSVSGVYGYVAVVAAVAAIVSGRISPALVIASSILVGVALEFARMRLAKGSSADGKRVFQSFWMIPLLFLGYGLMAFGGGFVLVPVYIRDFVGAAAPHLQLAPHDFANIMAITEMTPGPVAINCATFFGYQFGGVVGAVVATLSLLLPGSIILWLALRSIERFRSSLIVRGIFFGVRPVTVALLICATLALAGMSIWQSTESGIQFSPLATVLAVLTLIVVRLRWLGAVPIIVLSALAALAAVG